MPTLEERIWIIGNYKSLGVNACAYYWPFESPAPSRSTVSRTVSRFKTTGSVLNKKPTGRKKTATSVEKSEEVRNAVLANPKTSVSRLALELGMSRSSTFLNLKSLDLKAYHPTVVQELLPEDYGKR
jgi:hypothetical protein